MDRRTHSSTLLASGSVVSGPQARAATPVAPRADNIVLSAMDRVSGLDQPIATYLRRNLYITASGMFVPDYLQRAAAIVGTDRLLFSTDYPYQYRPGQDARRFLDDCGLDANAKAAFAHGNWERLTRSTA